MPLSYSVIEIFTGEEARHRKRPVHEAVVDYIRSLKLAARCIVFRGSEGSYESGEVVTRKILNFSFNMPLKIEILLPAAETDRVLPMLEGMVTDGVIGVRDLTVHAYKARKHLFPRQIRVRDVMTPSPAAVPESETVDRVARLLLGSAFTGLPVVDGAGAPVGIISQGDLIYRAGMPVRLGLLGKNDSAGMAAALAPLGRKQAREIMSTPAVGIASEAFLTEAVTRMLEKKVKRLPVTDEKGHLTGILTRMDVFRTVTRESPDWGAIQQQRISVQDLRYVSDIMHRQTHTVAPDTPVDEVLRMIDSDRIRRVAVIDVEGRFLGMISDKDLLAAFSEHQTGLLAYFADKIKNIAAPEEDLPTTLREKTAREVMTSDLKTIHEDAPLEEAIQLLYERKFKRIPVIDGQGRYRGMISRESLLQVGFLGP